MTYQYLHGVETELTKLAEFPAKVEANVTRGAVRAAAVVMKNAVSPLVPRVTGALAATLRVSSGMRGGVAKASVKIGNPKRGVFYAGMVMGGTRPHLVRGRTGEGFLSFGGLVRRVVHHPGAKAQPFMEEANSRARDASLEAAFNYADTRLAKILAEQGNDRG